VVNSEAVVAEVGALESLLAVVGGGDGGIEEASNGCAPDLKNIDWTPCLTPEEWGEAWESWP